MKNKFIYFIYISILFLFIYLYKLNYFNEIKVVSLWLVFLSLLFLCFGFFTTGLAWWKNLTEYNYHVSISECFAGIGLSIFGKYIPGKLWVVVGRAAYISEKRNLSLKSISLISLNDQFITIWVGLLLGALGLFILGGFHLWGWLAILLWCGLSLVLFSRVFHILVEYMATRILKKKIVITSLKLKTTLSLLPWYILTWLLWSIAFYCFVAGLSSNNISLGTGLIFPLAGSLGIIAIISPGGIGVREGIMVGLLNLTGISIQEATTISIASRLWFLIGEGFIFVLGLLADKTNTLKTNSAEVVKIKNVANK